MSDVTASVTQMEELSSSKRPVEGSSPSGGTITFFFFCRTAHLGMGLVLHAGREEFDSLVLYHCSNPRRDNCVRIRTSAITKLGRSNDY